MRPFRVLIGAMPVTGRLSPQHAQAVRGLVVGLVVSLLAYTAYVAVLRGALPALDTLFTTWVFSGLTLGAALVCLVRAVLVEADRKVWALLAAGMASWGLGSIWWSVFLSDLDAPPYPSMADVLYLSFYPAAYAALMLLANRRVHGVHRSSWLDGLIAALAMASLGAAFVVPSLFMDAEGTRAAVITNLAYPLADLLLIALVTGIFALTSWRPGRAWLLIGAGLVLLAVADCLYLYRVAQDTFVAGTWLDAIWPAGMVLVAFAALTHTAREVKTTSRDWPTLLVPILFTLGALGVLLYGSIEQTNPMALALAAATVLAALARMALSLQEVRSLSESRRLAITDDLTGLPNRRLLHMRLAELTARPASDQATAALFVADLDGFKELNDTLGHHAGDLVLRQLGPRVRSVLRDGDTLARLGGDEFAVLLPDCDTPTAVAVVERVQQALAQSLSIRGLPIHVQASVGLVTFPRHGRNADTLLQRADIAMYQAKGARTGYEIYVAERDNHSLDRVKLLGELRGAIERSELVVHFQPKASLATGKVTGVEALVRWQHPERGLLGPLEFIPMAEQTDLMRPLTLSVLTTAVSQCRQWLDAGFDLTVAVNLATPNLLDFGLPADVARLLRNGRVPPRNLQLEVTENVVMADPVRALAVLRSLKALGVGLSLDDFGTGTSSLSQLKSLPVDELKVDRSFVLGLKEDEANVAIVRATIQIGHELGLAVVAEGIETQENWDELVELGCDLGQGYWLCRPVSAPVLREWLANREQVGSLPVQSQR